jgi:hypothetical protein
MDVATVVANRARRRRIHPLDVEKSSCSRMELNIMPPELAMAANLTSDLMSVNLDGRDLLVSKDALLATE